MGLKDTAGNFLSNSLGNVEKAIIRVVDDGNIQGDDTHGSKLRNAEEPVNGLMGNVFDNVADKATSIEQLAKLSAFGESDFKRGKQFTVQFNPSTLLFNSSGGGYSEIKNFNKDEKSAEKEGNDIGIQYGQVPFQVTLDVDLIFNKVNPNDAFVEMGQSLGTIKGAYNAVTNIAGVQASYSVQNEIEGLIAATRYLQTCLISFNWGKMSYSGILQNLRTNYTMFNPKGEPIAGTAHLSMILIDENVNLLSKGKWVAAYAAAFSDPRSLGSAESVVGGSAFSNFTF